MGFAIVAGGNPSMAVPVAGIAAGDIAVGSTVKLLESGTAVEYLVVNQGIPSSSNLYDSSCDGTWLLRKAIKESRVFGSNSAYASSAINTWLNGTFFNTIGTGNAIKQVKIPYVASGAVKSGANGLSAKVFLLSCTELGWTIQQHSIYVDGAAVSYFNGTSDTDSKRIAYLNSTATAYFSRSADTEGSTSVVGSSATGGIAWLTASVANGIRPALILSKTAIFDKDTMILKGAA